MALEKDRPGPAGAGNSECEKVADAKPTRAAQYAAAPSEPAIGVLQTDVVPARPYSVFTGLEKRAIILSASFMGLLSFMGSSIYFPAVNQVCMAICVFSHRY